MTLSVMRGIGDEKRGILISPVIPLLIGVIVYNMGKQMYFWGWSLVNLHNRVLIIEHVPEPGLNGGVVPVVPLGCLSMLADYITPDQSYIKIYSVHLLSR
ncbi:hypothetical protein D3C78_1536070 [compost metagenome]